MKRVMVLRSSYNYDTDEVSNETGMKFDPDEGRTQQSFAEECDINTIVSRFGLTGELPENFRAPVSGDFTGVSDFHSAMNAVRQAQEQFDAMPGELRARFDNDPQKLMRFVENEKNREQAMELGILRPPPEKTRDVVAAVDELAAKLVPPAVK